MKLLFWTSMLIFMGCGDISSAGAPGVFVDSTFEEKLEREFYEVKECGGFIGGSYSTLTVILMPIIFPCEFYDGGCNGEYREPNFIKLGHQASWKHEVLHYLLDINFNDPDAEHKNPLFQSCT